MRNTHILMTRYFPALLSVLFLAAFVLSVWLLAYKADTGPSAAFCFLSSIGFGCYAARRHD